MGSKWWKASTYLRSQWHHHSAVLFTQPVLVMCCFRAINQDLGKLFWVYTCILRWFSGVMILRLFTMVILGEEKVYIKDMHCGWIGLMNRVTCEIRLDTECKHWIKTPVIPLFYTWQGCHQSEIKDIRKFREILWFFDSSLVRRKKKWFQGCH